ncbi:delta(1)-pyrroline-2-carboxylate reductase family protein [Megalodesulfovibrio paquesii]
MEAIAAVLRAKRAGTAQAPERLVVPLAPNARPGGLLLCMPATDAALAVTKLITVHPGNRDAGLPVIQGEMTVMDARTGRRLLLLDGATVTARRTAAVSVLAVRQLAVHPNGPLLLVGAGAQAAAHLEAFRDVLGVEQVYLASRSPASAQALAARARELGMAAEVVPAPAMALPRCPVVVTVTTSPTPVLPDMPITPDALGTPGTGRVREDACIVAVGSFHADQAEIPASLMRRARVVVDAPEAARHEAGDIILAGLDWAMVTPLEALLDGAAGSATGESSGLTVVKTVGCAYFDLAAGRVAVGGDDLGA